MEKYLQHRLHDFNTESANAYRNQWGTVLDFIDDNRISANGESMIPSQVFELQNRVKANDLRRTQSLLGTKTSNKANLLARSTRNQSQFDIVRNVQSQPDVDFIERDPSEY